MVVVGVGTTVVFGVKVLVGGDGVGIGTGVGVGVVVGLGLSVVFGGVFGVVVVVVVDVLQPLFPMADATTILLPFACLAS